MRHVPFTFFNIKPFRTGPISTLLYDILQKENKLQLSMLK